MNCQLLKGNTVLVNVNIFDVMLTVNSVEEIVM